MSGNGGGLNILINYISYLSNLLAILPWLDGLLHLNRRQFDFTWSSLLTKDKVREERQHPGA